MASQVLPDAIKNLDDVHNLKDKVDEIYDYILKMREDINFWGSRRQASISNIEAGINAMIEYDEATETIILKNVKAE